MRVWAAAALGWIALSAHAHAQQTPPERAQLRAIFEEMVEIDSSPTTGSCTRVAEAVAVRLRNAGYAESDVRVIIPPDRPDDGNVVATLRGSQRRGAILLLAHIDVVDARREDWERDPFTLVEENGYFYGRGTADDKAMAAVFTDLMIRMREENYRPRRTLKMALTCGEETSNRVNGVDYLLRNHRDLIQADFAINEGAGGLLTNDGRPVSLQIQAGEKIHQVFQLEVVNPGGHSSRPVPDNAIYRLSAGLERLSAYHFPVEINPVVRSYFAAMAPLTDQTDMAAAMRAIAANPNDADAAATLAEEPSFNAMMRTTCVATQLDAGHAPNALPQRARAILSCRLLQGTTPEQVQAQLSEVVADDQISVEIVRRREGSQAPRLTREILGPVERAGARLWPNTPIVPTMTVGATDGRFLNTAGIPTYGMSGMFAAPGESNAHGLNEKIRVQSLYEGADFLESIIRDYAR